MCCIDEKKLERFISGRGVGGARRLSSTPGAAGRILDLVAPDPVLYLYWMKLISQFKKKERKKEAKCVCWDGAVTRRFHHALLRE